QYMTLRLKLPNGTVYPLQLDQPVDATEGMNFIGNLTDEKIKQLYLQSPKVSEEVKRIILAEIPDLYAKKLTDLITELFQKSGFKEFKLHQELNPRSLKIR
ncbi:MAG: hypothetical protein EBZ85_01450, partial [Actinobacteria bacterium]|nr:hypothetical protein [Actinomycetota bacterium]